ncbi:uncharacterized protein BJX67DRAFT_53063 [Aspergillus lucknowensis]|uniref:Uncharacterized protein n=1 Tax=Aspergillus lucknowensis TaxID=176173 RepID=A0ABR4LUR7_9EURO
MAMAVSQVQTLLRFLSQDAKLPLAAAMGKVNELLQAGLTCPEDISKGGIDLVQGIFTDGKVAKQVLNAATRVSKKRAASEERPGLSPQKRPKTSAYGKDDTTPFETECALALPASTASEEELANIVLITNRAPLVLAFALCVLRYTMPEQPISSRLSLSQAVVSANSRSKAVSLGLESDQSVEQECRGEGQPTIRILGRDIKVLKRWDYNPRDGQPPGEYLPVDDVLGDRLPDNSKPAPPIWGIDTGAIGRTRRSDMRGMEEKTLPIYTPQSARSYLLKSFVKAPDEDTKALSSSGRPSPARLEAEKEACVGHVLRSIDLVCRSWVSTLDADELDRLAWNWYVHVRPSVKSGVEGWGEKGLVKLSEILAFKRKS